MPETEVILFAEADGSVPLLKWLDGLGTKSQIKCIAKIERLAARGHELRRPEADYLRDGIYELRVALQGRQYRVLYSYHGKQAVISHGIIKERIVEPREIDLARHRKIIFENDPVKHVYRE